MTPKRIAELRELCEKATPGPWYAYPNTLAGRVWISKDRVPAGHVVAESMFERVKGYVTRHLGFRFWRNEYKVGKDAYAEAAHNVAWVVAARTALPEALDQIERLTRKEG